MLIRVIKSRITQEGQHTGITEDSIIQGNDKLIAVIGVGNLIVVDSKDALLIADTDHAGEIKEVMELLEKEGREDLL